MNITNRREHNKLPRDTPDAPPSMLKKIHWVLTTLCVLCFNQFLIHFTIFPQIELAMIFSEGVQYQKP